VLNILQEWSIVFMRRSMHDFMDYTHGNNLSMSQINVLIWLYYHKQIEIMRLEEVMQVSRPAASQMVGRMVQQGLVQRTPSATDRRSRLVSLTERGTQIVEEAIAARTAWMNGLIESLNPDQKLSVALALKLLSEHASALDTQPHE
jgi:DNA-binding MarR family transcriptional regulator